MKTNFKALALVAGLLAWAIPSLALAQVPQAPNVRTTWLELGKITGGVSVSTSSNPTALPQGGNTAWVCNTGTTDAYLAFGGSGVAAQSGGNNNNSWLKAGNCQNYNLERPTSGGVSTFMAAVTATGTTTLQVETGIGANTSSASSSGGGSGGNVNVTQWNSVGISSPTAWGSAPAGGSIVPNMNVNCLAGCASGTNTTATGTITSTQSVAVTPGAGQSTVGIQVTGTWTGTLFVEGSVDGTNYVQTTLIPILSGSVQTATITANGIFQANVAGLASFRIRGNTVASGTATVTLISSGGAGTVMADNPFPVTGYSGMTPLNMQGSVAIGSATSAFPVMMGGSSTGGSGGNAQIAKVDASGTQYFDAVAGGTLMTAVNNPPLLSANGVNHAWTGLTPGVPQTGTIYAGNTDLTSVGGTATPTGAGTASAGGVQRVAAAQDATTVAGSAPVKGGVPVVNGASVWNTIAASQTAQSMSSVQGGTTGAVGDYISHCVITPATTSPGAVQVFDGTNTATNDVINFPGGASSVSNLVPIPIPLGSVSVNSGGWKVTTGANVSVQCFGKFT